MKPDFSSEPRPLSLQKTNFIYLAEVRLPTKNAHGFQIMWMCEAFAAGGAAVELVAPRRWNLFQEDPFVFYRVRRTFTITRLPVIDLYPIRLIPEKISGFLLRISFLLAARIYLLFRRHDVLYTREPYARILFPSAVIEVHSPEQLRRPAYGARGVVAITDYLKRQLIDRGVSSRRILVEPDAVDLALFTPLREKAEARRRLGFPLDIPIALYWGNFKAWKGVDTFAEAVPLLPEVFSIVVGATKESDLARIRRALSGVSHARVRGFTPHEELPWYLAAADFLILPNTKKDENSALCTSPIKLFEYMAAERPIIAADLPSLREILHEESALFFEADNPGDLARKIKELLLDPARGGRLAARARQDVEAHTWEKRARRISDFIEQL